ncbi:prolyl 4-hydroxylase subunit alpha-1-like isoform X2 [Babylonia areolata]|uniref:prolyl 4-hydroxylase subunit alpha-1-like isoform X2 n=1 Tax=Babylonia areolata TaxID=304850 RepID=UPI003FD55BA6
MPDLLKNFLLFACVASLVRGEVFTSMAHLESTLYAERDVASLIKSHVQQERERLNKLEKVAEDYAEHSRKSLSDPSFYLGNPVNAFLLIKRLTLDWDKDVLPLLGNNSLKDFNLELQFARQGLPTFEDLTGAATALMRLQDTYHLDTSKIAHGDIAGVVSTTLSAAECFLLGRLSYNQKDHYHTILWMQEALDIDKETYSTPENRTVDRSEVLDYLSYAMAMQGHVKHALTLTNELLELDPGHQRAFNNKRYFEDMLTRQGESPSGSSERPAVKRSVDSYRQSSEFQTYEALCRGENTQKIKDEHKLRCQYVSNNDPLLMIQPLKEEEMHLDPWIVVYHDVLSEKEMADIKMLATPRLNRATVQNSVTGQLETASYRISKSAWLKGSDHPTIAKVNQKIQAITGLELETAEELQIANYGLGGQYEPHFDFARDRKSTLFEMQMGNRIATFLIYMTDVEAGGATVFPYLGLKLYPKKGAAAFWYNLYKNGDGIYNTRHAACPVLVGTKWVSNKWIHERGQEFRRPCSLSPDE